jgi:glycosyltransferase involved in cell wall biosynthesis
MKTLSAIPSQFMNDIILVDDASTDETVKLAKKLNLHVIVHPRNAGYGANQKTCYDAALKAGADIVVMLHPDYQYDPTYIPQLVQPIVDGKRDIMLGSRITTFTKARHEGMPTYKYIANRFLTLIENAVLDQYLSEYHTGFRAFSKQSLDIIKYKSFSNDFVFDQEMLIVGIKSGLKVGEISIPAKYFPDASSINFRRSVQYGLKTLSTLFANK